MLNALLATPPAAPVATSAPNTPEAEAGDGRFARLLDQARPAPPPRANAADGADAATGHETPDEAEATPAGAARPTNPATKALRGLPRTAHAAPKSEAAPAEATTVAPAAEAAAAATPDDAAAAPTSKPLPDARPAADPAALLALLTPLPPATPAAVQPGGAEGRDGAADLVARAVAHARTAALPVEPGPAAVAPSTSAGKPGSAPATVEAMAAAAPRVTDLTAERRDTLPAALPPVTPAAPAPQQIAAAEAKVATPPGQTGFAEELGARLSTFVRNGIEHARLELNPQDMGPVTVRIEIDGVNAQVSLAAEQAPTRTALEHALPALAGSLREAGLTLAGGGVFDQPRQPQAGRHGDGTTTGRRAARDDGLPALDALAASATLPPRRRGVVDLVA